jgi:hypothetical protein
LAPHSKDQAWRSIAEQASKEMDPANLTVLIAKLCDALDRERGKKPGFQPQQENQTESYPDLS